MGPGEGSNSREDVTGRGDVKEGFGHQDYLRM